MERAEEASRITLPKGEKKGKVFFFFLLLILNRASRPLATPPSLFVAFWINRTKKKRSKS